MKKAPSKAAHNRPKSFLSAWLPKRPKNRVPYNQKPLNAGLGFRLGLWVKFCHRYTLCFFFKFVLRANNSKKYRPNEFPRWFSPWIFFGIKPPWDSHLWSKRSPRCPYARLFQHYIQLWFLSYLPVKQIWRKSTVWGSWPLQMTTKTYFKVAWSGCLINNNKGQFKTVAENWDSKLHLLELSWPI